MKDITYNPDRPLDMGPTAYRKHYTWAGAEKPVLVDFEHRHGAMRIPEALVEELDGGWNPMRNDLQDVWDERVENGGWGAVAVATWSDEAMVDFMSDPSDLDHTCTRNIYRANRTVMQDFLKDKKRVRRTLLGATVKEPTWVVKDEYLFYDPTHTRTARLLAELLDPSTARIISDDYLNEIDHEVTDRLVDEHIREELRGSALEGEEKVFDAVREKIFEHVASWCPECHEIDRSAAEALAELGARKCYECARWFHPKGFGDERVVCLPCLDVGVDAEAAALERQETVREHLLRRSMRSLADRGHRRLPDSDRIAAAVVARGIMQRPHERTFGQHEQDLKAEYWMEQILPVVEEALRQR